MEWSARRKTIVGWVVALILVASFRVAVVATWHAPAGDGLQYYKLAQTLTEQHRFAFGTMQPLTFGRLPGYPLFLAYVAVRGIVPLPVHLVRATLWNVALDLATALLIASLLARLLPGQRRAELGFALVVACPLLIFLSCFGLSESLSTFLGTAEIYCCVMATRVERRGLWLAVIAGIAAGLGQLVRVDMITFLPGAVLLLWWSPLLPVRRLALVAVFLLSFAAAFSPWPLRNLHQFGATHIAGTEWIGQNGQPRPSGMALWLRTWSAALPGESYIPFVIANDRPMDPNSADYLRPSMYDDDTEKAALAALYRRYNRAPNSLDVDNAFAEYTRAHIARNPLRFYVWYPLRRMYAMWKPLPEYELPVRTPLLGLPWARPIYGYFLMALLLAAFGGAIHMWRTRAQLRPLVAAIITTVAGRTAIIGFVHAFPVQRYLAEIMPLMMLLAAYALTELRLWRSAK